jgi:hypothetical protein
MLNGIILNLPRRKKFTVFWDCEGEILVDVMPRGETIKSDAYIEMLTELKAFHMSSASQESNRNLASA